MTVSPITDHDASSIRPHSGRRGGRRRAASLTRRTALWLIAAVYSIPIYLMVVISLKTPAGIAESPFGLPLTPNWANYVEAWERSSGSAAPTLGESILNSAAITALAVLLILGLGSTAGYFLGRSKGRGANLLFLGFLSAITIPIQLVIIPVYTVFDEARVLGEIIPVALFYAGLLTPFAVFLFTGFVRALPGDLEEASRLDGCTHWQTFVHVMLPLLKPVVSTVAILTAIAVWNDFFGQLVFLLGSGNETLPLTVFNFASQYASRYDLLSAGLVIATVPLVIFYLILQRQIVEGFATGVKG